MPQHSSQYVPVYRTRKVNTDHKNIEKILINTPNLFHRMVKYWDNCGRTLSGFDTETTGLDTEKEKLVGCSFAFSFNKAFYLPFGHNKEGSQNLPSRYINEVGSLLDASDKVLMWNKRFDLRVRRDMMQHDISVPNDVDPSILVFNWDSNIGLPALKRTAKEILGWELEDFSDTFGKNANLSHYSPEEVLDYACLDAVLLLHLYRAAYHMYGKAGYIIDVDEKVMRLMLDLEDLGHPIDREWLEQLGPCIKTEMKQIMEHIKKLLNKEVNPNSPQQVAKALLSLKIDTGEQTATGNMSTGEAQLKKVQNKHPFVNDVIRYRKLSKASSTYIKPLLAAVQSSRPVRFAYKTTNVPTGRFSGGTRGNNTYFTKVNIQGVTKSKSLDYFAIPGESEKSVLGWLFHPISKDENGNRIACGKVIGTDIEGWVVEGKDTANSLRKVFTCHPNHYYCHFDYKAEEMRIPANLSKDPVMIQMFLSGQDPHMQTAYMMFDEENYNSDFRKSAKILNFNLLFGGQKYSIGEKMGIPPVEAQHQIDKWWSVFNTLRLWKEDLVKKSRERGYVRTAFGRYRQVKFWTSSPIRGIRAFGDRTIVNSKIQGTAADIIRIALVRLSDADLLLAETNRFLSTVHDEVNFSIHKDCVLDNIPKIIDCMSVTKKGWQIPMEVDFEIGFSWGESWPFHFNPEGQLVPTGTWVRK